MEFSIGGLVAIIVVIAFGAFVYKKFKEQRSSGSGGGGVRRSGKKPHEK